VLTPQATAGMSVGTYWPWVTATLRSARRREALRRPHSEERGGSISWRPPAYSLLLLSAPPYYVVGADIAITLSRCVCLYVSTIKRKLLILTLQLPQVDYHAKFGHFKSNGIAYAGQGVKICSWTAVLKV